MAGLGDGLDVKGEEECHVQGNYSVPCQQNLQCHSERQRRLEKKKLEMRENIVNLLFKYLVFEMLLKFPRMNIREVSWVRASVISVLLASNRSHKGE